MKKSSFSSMDEKQYYLDVGKDFPKSAVEQTKEESYASDKFKLNNNNNNSINNNINVSNNLDNHSSHDEMGLFLRLEKNWENNSRIFLANNKNVTTGNNYNIGIDMNNNTKNFFNTNTKGMGNDVNGKNQRNSFNMNRKYRNCKNKTNTFNKNIGSRGEKKDEQGGKEQWKKEQWEKEQKECQKEQEQEDRHGEEFQEEQEYQDEGWLKRNEMEQMYYGENNFIAENNNMDERFDENNMYEENKIDPSYETGTSYLTKRQTGFDIFQKNKMNKKNYNSKTYNDSLNKKYRGILSNTSTNNKNGENQKFTNYQNKELLHNNKGDQGNNGNQTSYFQSKEAGSTHVNKYNKNKTNIGKGNNNRSKMSRNVYKNVVSKSINKNCTNKNNINRENIKRGYVNTNIMRNENRNDVSKNNNRNDMTNFIGASHMPTSFRKYFDSTSANQGNEINVENEYDELNQRMMNWKLKYTDKNFRNEKGEVREGKEEVKELLKEQPWGEEEVFPNKLYQNFNQQENYEVATVRGKEGPTYDMDKLEHTFQKFRRNFFNDKENENERRPMCSFLDSLSDVSEISEEIDIQVYDLCEDNENTLEGNKYGDNENTGEYSLSIKQEENTFNTPAVVKWNWKESTGNSNYLMNQGEMPCNAATYNQNNMFNINTLGDVVKHRRERHTTMNYTYRKNMNMNKNIYNENESYYKKTSLPYFTNDENTEDVGDPCSLGDYQNTQPEEKGNWSNTEREHLKTYINSVDNTSFLTTFDNSKVIFDITKVEETVKNPDEICGESVPSNPYADLDVCWTNDSDSKIGNVSTGDSRSGSESVSVSESESEHNLSEALQNETPSNNLPVSDIKIEDMIISSYVPYPPEKYSNIYELHEIKILSPHILKTRFEKEGDSYHSTLKDGKLILLLDLDNTLLQATSYAKLNMELPLENFIDENGDPELYKFFLPAYNFYYFLKFRPYVRQFLQILSLYYELSIYTNATREYADVVIAILDPDRTLFADRIVARCSSVDREETKYFSRIYPKVDPKYVIAFDDRKDVWIDIPQSHILKAEHYNFFELSKYDLVSHFKEPATCRKKFTDLDRHLYYMTKVFLKLHKRFFENPLEVDVGQLIKEIMTDTLKNVGVYFTGFRKNAKNLQNVLHADCEERQKEMALELGAKIHTKYNKPGVTHIIAAKDCTDNLIKSKEAEYDHIHKVHTLWLYHCRGTLENVDCSKFNVFDLCKIYSNKPPVHPKKDHWFFGCGNTKEEEVSQDCVKVENVKSRIFLGTGEYTHDAVILSPYEQISIQWNEKEVKLRQNYNTTFHVTTNVVNDVRNREPFSKTQDEPFCNSLGEGGEEEGESGEGGGEGESREGGGGEGDGESGEAEEENRSLYMEPLSKEQMKDTFEQANYEEEEEESVSCYGEKGAQIENSVVTDANLSSSYSVL